MLRRIGLLALAIALMLAGCGKALPADVSAIALGGWQSSPSEGKLVARVLRQFEAEHPKIKVKFEAINDRYMDAIATRLVGDAAPDAFYLDASEAPGLIKYEVLEPLNSYIRPEFDLADFEPSLLQAFKRNETIYGLPKDFSTLALFYNTQAFAAAGLTAPPHTWQELGDRARKLTLASDRGGVERYGYGLTAELARWEYVIRAFGGSAVDRHGNAAFASPSSIRGLQLLVDGYRRDRTSAQPSDVGASSGSEMFGRGRAAMAIEGPWAIPFLRDTFPERRFAIAELPTINGKKGTMTYTVAYVINKQSKHKAAAWQLVAYLTGKKGMEAWAKEGLALPARKSAIARLGYERDPLYAPFAAGGIYGTVWQGGENLPIVKNQFNNQFTSALLGEQPLQKALNKAQKAANKEIFLSN